MSGLFGKEISDETALSQSISELIKQEDKLQQGVCDLQTERTLTLFSATMFDYLGQTMKATTDENTMLRTRLRDLKAKLRRQCRSAVAFDERQVSRDVVLLQAGIENAHKREAQLQQEIEAQTDEGARADTDD